MIVGEQVKRSCEGNSNNVSQQMVERQLCNELMFTQGDGNSGTGYMDGHDVKHKDVVTIDVTRFLIKNYSFKLFILPATIC